MIDVLQIKIGLVYEVAGYGYPMLVERLDTLGDSIRSVTFRPATQVAGVWRTYGTFDLQIPCSLLGKKLVKKIA
jgi:hypothetical protein